MSHFYHMVPEPFFGTELIPLNEMNKESSLYKSHAKKYVGRESLTEQTIPILNCLWNDVVQFSALDPQLIVNKLKILQPEFKLKRLDYFKIPIEEIENVYEGVSFDRLSSRKSFEILSEEVKILTKENYKELKEVPEATIQFWKTAIAQKRPVLWFPYITHVFLKGRVETSTFEKLSIKF